MPSLDPQLFAYSFTGMSDSAANDSVFGFKPVRFDASGVRIEVDDLLCFEAKFDSNASAIDFVHGLRPLKGLRAFSIKAEIDGETVSFGRKRDSTDFVRFSKWFQRHIEETDKIEVKAGWGLLRWESPQSRARSEADDPMSGRVNCAAVTIGGRNLDPKQYDELRVAFEVNVDDESLDASDAFLIEAGVGQGSMIPSYGMLSIF